MPPGTEEERQLLLEAGAELASLGCNMQSLQFFGLKWMEQKNFQGTLAKLRGWGLPVMVAPNAECIEENDHTISTIFHRPATAPQRRLICAFDRTYLETSMQLVAMETGSCMSGGTVWLPEDVCFQLFSMYLNGF